MDDSSVNYSKLIESTLFKDEYLLLAEKLKQTELNKLDSDASVKAFFISKSVSCFDNHYFKNNHRLFNFI